MSTPGWHGEDVGSGWHGSQVYETRHDETPQGRWRDAPPEKQHAKKEEAKPRRQKQDGDIASCRRCGNQVMYSEANQRWEHTGKGKAECFGK